LPGGQAAVRVTSARKEKCTNPSWGGPDVIIDRFSGLFAQFEADGMSEILSPQGATLILFGTAKHQFCSTFSLSDLSLSPQRAYTSKQITTHRHVD
jgi:hypothetical protein